MDEQNLEPGKTYLYKLQLPTGESIGELFIDEEMTAKEKVYVRCSFLRNGEVHEHWYDKDQLLSELEILAELER